ncbi:MAG: DUF1304 domain-containing protein [Pseudomonadota bacterium]
MGVLASLVVSIVAVLHVGFLVLEMFLWTHPIGLKVFHQGDAEFADRSKALGQNMGLYNGFLAAGLFWSLSQGRVDVVVFFLLCVVVAGVYGSLTVKPRILWVQAAPAALALVLILLS